LPPFRLWGKASRHDGKHWHGIRQYTRGSRGGGSCPDQAAPRVIDYLGVRIEKFLLENRQVSVVQVKLEL
jgi:hypothetical protein